MAALTKPRGTLTRSGYRRYFPVKGSATIFQGALVAVGADGFAVPMSTATDLKGIGRADETVVNSAGGDGAASVTVDASIHRWGNSAGADEVTKADIGSVCYGVDDQTVAKTDGAATRSPAGTVFDVDADGVWVKSH